MDQLLTFPLFSDHFSCPLVTCIFPDDCSAVHPEDFCFLIINWMEMTVKVLSWMKLSYVIGLMIMKGKLFHQAMHHDIRCTILWIIVVTFIEVALAVISYFAHMQQCKSFHGSIVNIPIVFRSF